MSPASTTCLLYFYRSDVLKTKFWSQSWHLPLEPWKHTDKRKKCLSHSPFVPLHELIPWDLTLLRSASGDLQWTLLLYPSPKYSQPSSQKSPSRCFWSFSLSSHHLFILFERKQEREWITQMLFHFPFIHNSQGLVRLNPNSVQILLIDGMDPPTWAITCYLTESTAKIAEW